jgi:hypothetical protein
MSFDACATLGEHTDNKTKSNPLSGPFLHFFKITKSTHILSMAKGWNPTAWDEKVTTPHGVGFES